MVIKTNTGKGKTVKMSFDNGVNLPFNVASKHT